MRSEPVAERPVQVGDWVECVNDCSARDHLICAGERYRVLAVSFELERVSLFGVEDAGDCGWNITRFKRVDGPHTAAECAHCGESAGCAENCVTRATEPACANDAHYFSAGDDICIHCGIWRMNTYEYAHEQATETHCPECAAKLDPTNTGNAPYCVGCTNRRWPVVAVKASCSECGAPAKLNGGLCAYCDYSTDEGKQMRGARDWLAALKTSNDPRMVEPRKRLAALDRAERPRLTADAVAFAKPHPWELDE